MTRFAVQRCTGNSIEVLGICETKEKMLQAKERFCRQHARQARGTALSGSVSFRRIHARIIA